MTILKAKFKMKQIYKKLVKEKSFSNSRFSKSNLTVFAIIFASIGGYIIYSSFAAGFASSIEPENGTVSSPATVFNDANASGGKGVQFGSAGSCSNNVSCWPNATNTGYQNAPGYSGTKGVADTTKLTTASAGSSTCPTTFQSNKTYSFCHYTGVGQFIGSRDNHLTNVHFYGVLFEGTAPTADPAMVMMYCDNNCTLDYITIKPQALDAPDLPNRGGTSWAKSYSAAIAAGWGAYYSYARGLSITHSDIWGFGSGIILGGGGDAARPNIIEDTWIHDPADCPDGCTTHQDGIGMVDTGGTLSYVTLNHNNIPFTTGNTNTLAFQQGTYDHMTITNNALSGDGFTVALWDTSTNTKFTGNVWSNTTQQYYRVNYGMNFWDTSGSCWARNKFLWNPNGVSPLYDYGPGYGTQSGPITAADSGKYWVPDGLSTTDYKAGSC
jgi:hypothetical protein